MTRPLALVALALIAAAAPAAAQTRVDSSAGPLTLTRVAGPLEHPWAVDFLPDGRAIVTERPGRLSLVDVATGRLTEVAGAPDVAARGQGGLLDVAVDPRFAETGLVFLTYAERAAGGAATAMAKARLTLEPAPRLEALEVLFRQTPALPGGRHFGARVLPAADGALFVTLGDRGEAERAQATDETVGKVVRVDRDGEPPADNPFVDRAGYAPEIWSIGHRNAQGAAIDPATGLLWTVEHGAAGGDEVNRVEPGRNYGWPTITYGVDYSGAPIGEGTAAEGLEQPAHYWDPSIAPSGLAVVTGAAFEAWAGDLVLGALKERMLVRLDREGERVVGEERLLVDAVGRIRDVTIGPDGALWLVTDEPDGALWRLAPEGR